MALQFRRAEKTKARLRLALMGPSGSGKSFTSLVLGHALAEGGRFCVIDTERGSASLYADLFEFDVLELETFDPRTYVEAIQAAERERYTVIIIDSLSHAWEGKGGALELVDKAVKRSQSGNSFNAWREVTPLHNQLVDAMIGSSAHIIATMRTKTEYVQEKDERTGKTVPRKIGLAPRQRDGLEYEFSVCGELDWDHNLIISKSRIPALADQVINRPGPQLGEAMLRWLNSGAEPEEQPAMPPATEQPPSPAPAPAEKPASSQRQSTAGTAPLSQHEALTQMTDFEPKEFVARAAALGYVLPNGGGNDYIRIVAALGLNPAAKQKDAGAQLADWRKLPGNTYRKALATLADRKQEQGRQATAAPADPTAPAAADGWQDRPATEPQIKAILAVGRGAQAMDDGTIEAWVRERFGCPLAELSRHQASEAIDALKLGTGLPPANGPKADEDAPPFDACPRCKGEQWQGGVCQQCGYGVGDEDPACRECGAVGGIKDGTCTFCGTDQLPAAVQAVGVPPVAATEQPALVGVDAAS